MFFFNLLSHYKYCSSGKQSHLGSSDGLNESKSMFLAPMMCDQGLGLNKFVIAELFEYE